MLYFLSSVSVCISLTGAGTAASSFGPRSSNEREKGKEKQQESSAKWEEGEKEEGKGFNT